MAGWRMTAGVILALATTGTLRAQSYSLREAPLPGAFLRIELEMTLKGEVRVRQGDKTVAIAQAASAHHRFDERILEAGPTGLADKAARFYRTAEATLGSGKEGTQRTLRPERSFLVAQRVHDEIVAFSPRGPLTREEQELTEHFDALALPGLLPAKDAAVGDTWKISNAAAQALCYLDGLTGHDLTCTLDGVKDDVASISLKGTADGIDRGAAVKLAIEARYRFDIKAGRIVALDWKQTDEREQGPVSPALKFEVNIKLTRTPSEPIDELSDVALVPVPRSPTPPEHLTSLSYRDPAGRYQLIHAREWQTVARTDDYLVLRLMDRGDFVAQATVKPWTKAEPGKHLGEQEFIDAMSQAPGWKVEQLLEEKGKTVPTENKNWIFRVAALGELDGVPALQYFYLIAGPQGDQVVVTFTLSPNQAQKLGTRDLPFVRELTFPAKREP